MKKLTRSCLALLALLPVTQSQAAFHLFDIQEVFSNSNGTVQYIELFTTASNERFLDDHVITFEINSAVQQTFTFNSDLPGPTTNKSVLIGTANLTALFGITPDYTLPENFFIPGPNATINFHLGTDIVSITTLPTDGVQSLNGNIASTTPTNVSVNSQGTPTNFAGQSAIIPEPGSALLLLASSAMVLRRRKR